MSAAPPHRRTPRGALLVGFGATAGGGALFLLIASGIGGDPHWLDRAILRALRSGDPADPVGPYLVEKFFTDITALGGRSVLGLVAVLVALYLAILRQWASLALLLVTLVGGSLVGDATKAVFDRPRPDVVAHLVEVRSPSFPSGHATYSAVAWLTLGALLARAQPRRTLAAYVLGCAVFLTVLVGFSRVYLGVHYPSDVLAGWCLGAAWATGCWLAAGMMAERMRGG